MQSSARHLLLIIGSILTIFGVLTFFFLTEEQLFKIVGGILFAAGVLLITRAIKNPHQHKNRLPDIRNRYKATSNQNPNSSSNEIH